MNTHKLLVNILSILIGCLFMTTPIQAAEDINGMSQCMVLCKGDKNCVNGCVSQYTTRGTAKDILQCLAGCGLGISTQSDNATLMETIKACCQGCLNSMH
ncbi:hypothetical protein [Legionella quateirensis]|uniref:Uncharacterized protein n=1 Tax=Legionella quateirensis TaxID=45072 RepID=A0A378KRL5_9GAMM|nr:hypothetical protein [Legionella quateirensis]KTD54786.1 hypothetical protein Lqua_0293 [Legionella quateirensis]STY16966.1 Uncharacterised protein [Legionella quateirensis]